MDEDSNSIGWAQYAQDVQLSRSHRLSNCQDTITYRCMRSPWLTIQREAAARHAPSPTAGHRSRCRDSADRPRGLDLRERGHWPNQEDPPATSDRSKCTQRTMHPTEEERSPSTRERNGRRNAGARRERRNDQETPLADGGTSQWWHGRDYRARSAHHRARGKATEPDPESVTPR